MKNLLLLSLLSASLCVLPRASLHAQCTNNVIDNPGFEQGAFTNWWNWHDNNPDAYSFETSADAFSGDSSARLNVLVDTDSLTSTNGAEYNSRPQTNAVVGGESYLIELTAKSTLDSTDLLLYIKDENDGWVQLHAATVSVGTSWTTVSTEWTADTTRPDIHLEIKVYNADFHVPYSVWIDDVTICAAADTSSAATQTCADNLVSNPGFEAGSTVDWWYWDNNDSTAYAFGTSGEAYVGDSSATIEVLTASDSLAGPAEYNNRPQVCPIDTTTNYRITFWAKSTEANTNVTVSLKDEFDNWATLADEAFAIGTDWTEVSFIWEPDVPRADVHLELKVLNPEFTAPYTVFFDEVSICATSDTVVTDPDPDPPVEDPIVYGVSGSDSACSDFLSADYHGFEPPFDLSGWDLWDGESNLAVATIDDSNPYAGVNAARVDVSADHDVAELHHRFGTRAVLELGETYQVSAWIRADIPAGDTVDVLTRATRDTDWATQGAVRFYVTSDQWLYFSHQFVAGDDWNNAFIELKALRKSGFSDGYTIWYDEVAVCKQSDLVATSLQPLADWTLAIAPNPAPTHVPSFLRIAAPTSHPRANLQVMDATGRTCWQQAIEIQAGEQSIPLPTQTLGAGLYFARLQTPEGSHTLKFLVVD